ncbi:MAG: TonB-dependent receptor [Myxococcales bacterium]|nr:MAG: TonB-dependent receptor [Myxococcales bacterium]
MKLKLPVCVSLFGLASLVSVVARAADDQPSEASQDAQAEKNAPAEGEAVSDLDLVKLLNVEVSTASKTSESVEDAPAVITVVTRDEIRRWGYQSVAEVLSHTVGFYLVDDDILPNASVRGVSGGLGAESSGIKVMIDGRSVAYRSTSGNWLGVELVPLQMVEQIEIIRGPASALYGADAFLGVVNIITTPPDAARPVRARVTAGLTETNPSSRFDVASGAQLGKFDLLLGAAGEYDDRSGLSLPAESPSPTLPAGVGDRRTTLDLKRRSLVLSGRVGYAGERGHVRFSASGSGLTRGGDLAHWAQLTSTKDGTRGTRVALGQFRLNVDALLKATHSLSFAVQSTYFQGGILPQDRVEIGSDLFYVERHQAYRGVDSMVEARYAPSSRLSVITGVEALYDREALGAPDRINRENGQAVLSGGVNRTEELVNIGSYASVNYKLLDPGLKLTGGLRFDRHSVYGSQVTGRVGVTSRLSKSVVAKLLYGSAFKAPSPYLLYATPLRPGDVVGNRFLNPQLIKTGEYQMSWTPARTFGVTSGVSYSWLDDKAEFTPQGINQTARNVASQESLSWETRADVRDYRYDLYASFDLVRSRRDLGQEGYAAKLVGRNNVVYPPWIARAGAMFAVPSVPDVPLELGAEGIWVGPRRASDTSIVERGASFDLPAYFQLDVTLATRELYLVPGHETRFALRGKNLLVARGPDPGFSGFEYPIQPAQIFLEVEHVY